MFERMEDFWQTVGKRAVCFLENERDVFWRNMGMGAVIFSRKIGKNGILLTHRAHSIV